MKKIALTIIILINILGHNVYAAGDSLASAAVTGAIFGTIYTMNSFMYREWLNSEINDWKYDETELTTSLSRGCNLNLELRIHKTRRVSYIVFVIHNQTEMMSTIKMDDINSTFSNGAVRRLKSNIIISDYKLDPGWTMQGVFPLDDKSELLNTDFVDVTIPVIQSDGKTQCEVKGRLNKNPKREALYEDYHRLITFEAGFFYGNNLVASKSLEHSSAQQGFFGLYMNFFGFKNYGFTLGILGQDLKTDNNAEVRTAKNLPSNSKVFETNFLFGVAGNFLFEKKFSTTLGAGVISHQLESSHDENAGSLAEKVGVFVNGTFNYVYYSSELLPVRGDYMIGLGTIVRYIPKYSVGTAQFGGMSLAPYANLGFAF